MMVNFIIQELNCSAFGSSHFLSVSLIRENPRGLRENLNTKSKPKDCSIAWPRPLPVIIPTADTEIASGTVLPPTWHTTLTFRQPYLKSCIIWTKCTRVNSICYICGRLRKQNWSSVCSFEFLNKIVKRQVMSDVIDIYQCQQ